MSSRLHVAFAALVAAFVAVTAWVVWDDARPEWRSYQRELVTRESRRLESELRREREALERPELRYERARLEAEIARADSSLPARRMAELRAAIAAGEASIAAIRARAQALERRLLEPGTSRRREAIAERLRAIEREFARATGAWPPDTLALRRLWAERDTMAGRLLAIEGPGQQLQDSLLLLEADAQVLRGDAARLTSRRDRLRAALARMSEPLRLREAALARWRAWTPAVREIASDDGREVARCPTCHGAIDDGPGLHPPLAAAETFSQVPCTVCHRGRGRALRVRQAHLGLLAAGDAEAGPYSVRGRVELLRSRDAALRARAREELREIAGGEPSLEGARAALANPESAAASAWADWWKVSRPFFEPAEGTADEPGAMPRAGVDPWIYSTRGRPLRYVGSRACLACHEVRHREHSRRWMATKFRSLERLIGEAQPRRCFPCHTTGYDPATGTYAEAGVTCEACHGPGERYNEMMTAGQQLLARGEMVRGRMLLDAASRLAREAVDRRMIPGDRDAVNVCVSCHHPWQHREGGPGILERDPPVAGQAREPRRGG